MIKITLHQSNIIKAGWFVNCYIFHYRQKIIIPVGILTMLHFFIYPTILEILKILHVCKPTSHFKTLLLLQIGLLFIQTIQKKYGLIFRCIVRLKEYFYQTYNTELSCIKNKFCEVFLSAKELVILLKKTVWQ